MPADVRVSDLRFTPGPPRHRLGGLLGFASFLVNDGLRIDGVAVRRKLDGALTLSWPVRTDATGERHAIVRPIDDETRRALERAVLSQLPREPDATTGAASRGTAP